LNIESIAVEYNVPEYLVVLIPIILFIMVIFLVVLAFKIFEPKFKLYKIDMFHGMLWKWKYKGERIIDLWCYCPKCKSMLLVDDENCKATSNLGDKTTFFICHECGDHEVGRIKGGDRHYALKVIIRAILAKIRLKTFDIYLYK
jgi:predicted RNA-binding Zn-ribbon protein involved in translation (DUF1610 family)